MAYIGKWSSVFSWPIIGIHAVLTQSGKLLTFGTDTDGSQGGMMVHDLWDPVTNEHHLIDHHMHTPTDIFCAAAVILPGTDKILIAGGDARPDGNPNNGVDDVNLYDDKTMMMMPAADGTMNVARWYPTVVNLPSGQVVVMGGIDADGVGQGTPEIYTPGEGWRLLDGAFDADIVAVNYYPKMWVGPSGEIFYFANGDGPDNQLQLMALDPSGDGSIRSVMRLPFYLDWMSPAIMYKTGHVLINDWRTGLFTLDLTTAQPTLTKVAELADDRNYSNMTVLADGTVLINGGTAVDNLEAHAETTALIWNPADNSLNEVGDEAHPRLYHSSTILLPDGTALSLGGGSASIAEKDYLDGQIFRPGYLFNADGSDALRPVVTAAPAKLAPGDTFRITVDDADAITNLTFQKTGAVTHNLNMDARGTTLSFTHVDAHTLEVRLPADATAITAGSWMLFAWNAAGVPAVAPIIAVEPTAAPYDGIGDLTERTFAVAPGVTSIDQVDWNAAPVAERLTPRIEETTGKVATSFTGSFRTEAAGSYTFYLTVDAQARLWIDGVAINPDPGGSGPAGYQATIALMQGIHTIELRTLATGAQTGAVDFEWSGAAFARRQLTFDGVVDNLLANGSLERAPNASGLPGWTSAGAIETHADGDLGLQARSGHTFAEVDAVTGALSQTVSTVMHADYTLGIDVAGNPNGVASSKLEVVVNGVVIGTITPTDTAWHRYDLRFMGMGHDTITIRAVAGDTDAVGALVDTVVLLGPPGKASVEPNHIMGTMGNDVLTGTAADDYMMGMAGDDRLSGGAGRDLLEGGAGNDVLAGGRGNDRLDGGTGVDTADYSASIEALMLDLRIAAPQSVGKLGADRLLHIENLIGGRGADHLIGDDAANWLQGGIGDDMLEGGGGADRLEGGKGRDMLTGGAGRDVFVFTSGTSATGVNRDMIRDFVQGEDRIATSGSVGMFLGTQGFKGHAGEIRYKIADGMTIIQVDEDGDRKADLEIGLTGVFTLTNSDFATLPGAGVSGSPRGDAGFQFLHVTSHAALDGTAHIWLA